MRVAYLGNFEPPHSTENHLASAFEANGYPVLRIQEGDVAAVDVAALTRGADLFVWTQTKSLADRGGTADDRRAMLDAIRHHGVPTVSYHLDLWWGLDREKQVREEAFFRTDLVITADGGHDELWEAEGIKHHWMPPGVSTYECRPGRFREELASDVAFVGSWQGGYHAESKHRHELVDFLRARFADRCRFWPAKGQPALRGEALRDLYASVKVVVGDSCMVPHIARYVSDRVPETVGRGGFLLHPVVEGVTDGSEYEPGRHLAAWFAGGWDMLGGLIEHYVAAGDERLAIAEAGRRHVIAKHTYEVRVRQLFDLLREHGMLIFDTAAA